MLTAEITSRAAASIVEDFMNMMIIEEPPKKRDWEAL
jgi:hypothetical protein